MGVRMTLSKLGPAVDTSGQRHETPVVDDNSMSLLERILKELKISNLHNAVKTDNLFTKQDVE